MAAKSEHIEVLRALDRREVGLDALGEFRPARLSKLGRPPRNPLRVAWRALVWGRTLSALWLRHRWDLLFRRERRRLTAEAVQRALRRLGPVAGKVAQAFSYRMDLMPALVAYELASADDRMPAPPIERVVLLVERALGGPLHEHFAAFDPQPMGSRAIRCTYRAELLDGREVVVRVRRPRIRQRLSEELAALAALFLLAEALTLVRPGYFSYIRRETSQILMDEVDFRTEARLRTLFHEQARKDRVRFVDARRSDLAQVSEAVAVIEYVRSTSVAELIAAVESDDTRRLARFAEQGITPRRVARRLLRLAWWEICETMFFHSEPSPADILVVPDSRLVLAHFDNCATTSTSNKRMLIELYRRLVEDDVSEATQLLVAMLEPLPFIDTDAFAKEVEGRLWQELFALRDPGAAWWERTSAGVWTALLDVTRGYGVVVHNDVLCVARASIMYGAMAARLWPQVDLLREFQRYEQRRDRRRVKRWSKDMRRRTRGRPGTAVAAAVVETLTLSQRAAFYLRRTVEKLPLATLAMPRKAAYVAVVLLRAVAVGLSLVALAALVFALLGRAAGPSEAVLLALRSPVVLGLLALHVLLTSRRLLFRLADIDED